MFLHVVDITGIPHEINVFHISMLSHTGTSAIDITLINNKVIPVIGKSFPEIVNDIETLRKAACTSSR